VHQRIPARNEGRRLFRKELVKAPFKLVLGHAPRLALMRWALTTIVLRAESLDLDRGLQGQIAG
jgi:hypothetical protein